MGDDHPSIAKALERAIEKNVIVVASAGRRVYTPIAFPAKCDRIFCIGSANGYGAQAVSNPANGKSEKFSALGEGVQVEWPPSADPLNDPELMSGYRCLPGSSTAAVVAAGIASLLIDFTRQFCNYAEGADNFENMRKLFREMSRQTATKEYPFLDLVSLFDRPDPKLRIKSILLEGSYGL